MSFGSNPNIDCEIIVYANKVLDELDPAKTKSGILVILKKNTGVVKFLAVIGNNKKQDAVFAVQSIRQAEYLYVLRGVHKSSFAYRKPGMFEDAGGAIIAGDYIVSFFGMENPRENDAMAILIARHFGWISEEEADALAVISDNEIYGALKTRQIG
jgi:hypothetical protein